MVRACVIILCLLSAGGIISAWAAAPIVRGPTPFDVAYARFLDAQSAAGELTPSEERFHRFATKHFKQGAWRERLSRPAGQLRVTAQGPQGRALNIAYVSYTPTSVHDAAASSSFEWHHVRYESRTSRHGRYIVLRIPIWLPIAAFLVYPAIQFMLWRRMRWFWRGTRNASMAAIRTTRLWAGAFRGVGIAKTASISIPLLLGFFFLFAAAISHVCPVSWSRRTEEYGQRTNLRHFHNAMANQDYIFARMIYSEFASWRSWQLAAVDEPLLNYGIHLDSGSCTFWTAKYFPRIPKQAKFCPRCKSSFASQVPTVSAFEIVCANCSARGGRQYGWSRLFVVEELPGNHFEAITRMTFRLLPSSLVFLVPGALLFLLCTRNPLRCWIRERRNQCIHCAYDLTGNTSGVCPECGRDTGRTDLCKQPT